MARFVTYLERTDDRRTWQLVPSGTRACSSITTDHTVNNTCTKCNGTGSVPLPFYEFKGAHAADCKKVLLKAGVMSDAPPFSPEVQAMRRYSAGMMGVAEVHDIMAIVGIQPVFCDVETFAFPPDYLVYKAIGKPLIAHFNLPLGGLREVSESKMMEMIHEVGDYQPVVDYVTRIKWQRPLAEHLPEFESVFLERLKLQPNPSNVRVVFWLR